MKTLFTLVIILLGFLSTALYSQGSSCTPDNPANKCYLTSYNYGSEFHRTDGGFATTKGKIKVEYSPTNSTGESNITATYIGSAWANHDYTETTILDHRFIIKVDGQTIYADSLHKLVDDYKSTRWYSTGIYDALHTGSNLSHNFTADTSSTITFHVLSEASTCPDGEVKSMNELNSDSMSFNFPVFEWFEPEVYNVSISGPTTRESVQYGDWTANFSGGVAPYEFEWQYTENGSTWYTISVGAFPSADDQTLTFGHDVDFQLKVKVTDDNDNYDWSNAFQVTIEEGEPCPPMQICGPGGPSEKAPDGIGEILPENFSLSQNYPNPFNPTTNITYSLSEESFVSLKVYNVTGQLVSVLVQERQQQGSYKEIFNASNLPSGMYYYRIDAGSFSKVQKMTLIK